MNNEKLAAGLASDLNRELEALTVMTMTMTMSDKTQKALELKTAVEDMTIRQYLKKLTKTVIIECDNFSGKHWFTDSYWIYDLYIPLVMAGLVDGVFDGSGVLVEVDSKMADAFICTLIDDM